MSSAEATLAEAEAKLSDDTDAGASDAQLAADASSVTSAQDQLDAANEALDGAQLVATFDGTVAAVDVTVGEELASGGTGGTDADRLGQRLGPVGRQPGVESGTAAARTASNGRLRQLDRARRSRS